MTEQDVQDTPAPADTPSGIHMENIGPVETIDIPTPDSGVVLIEGRNGSGKDHVIASVNRALAGEGALVLRRGAVQGMFEGLGVRMTATSRTTRAKDAREATVGHLDDPRDPAVLVDPGLVDELPADRRRIRVLLNLAGVTAGPTDFHGIFGGVEHFDEIVPAELMHSSDPVELADRVKKACDTEARKIEARAKARSADMDGIERRWAGIDLEAPHDAVELQAALEAAVNRRAELGTQAAAAEAHRERLAEARVKLRELTDDPEAALVPEAEQELAEAEGEAEATWTALEAARAALRDAEAGHAKATARTEQAKQRLKAARERATLLSGYRDVLEASAPPDVLEADLQAARDAVEAAHEAVALGQTVREARKGMAEYENLQAERDGLASDAKELREAGRSTDDVLSTMVQRTGLTDLFVRGGRLIYRKADGTDEFFADLSEGERFTIAFQVAGNVLPRGGWLGMSQRAWEGLDHEHRLMVRDLAVEKGIVILTGEAADRDIRARIWEG